ncbi:MAG: glycosyltransferase [Gemmatimonadota bacterium]|nr:glycosyltransferase [Gemmatimonadota bacterium]
MICILHGYLLEGSGSNLWTRSVVESLCRDGHTVQLVCQEPHPELYECIAEAYRYHEDGRVERLFSRAVPFRGRCIMHKPQLGDTLPVYVWDKYDEYPNVIPMVNLSDAQIESYIEKNARVVRRVVEERGVTAMHANHAVLMSVVAQRVSERTGVPFAVMPHGSALEYAVKPDPRFNAYATSAFNAAGHVFVLGEEIRQRVATMLPDVTGLDDKVSILPLGVHTAEFSPVPRERRREKMGRFWSALSPLARGRKPAQHAEMLERVRYAHDTDSLRLALTSIKYDMKAPDEDVEEKLQQIDWEHDAVLLYVGRLISAKGVQSGLAALPLILAEDPGVRLILVGHGPLREVMEAFVWALERGDRALIERIVDCGRLLEGDPDGAGGSHALGKVQGFLRDLDARGELDAYYDTARQHVRTDRVIFTGYLTHNELKHLFPCCDAGIFPSIVKEAGPLVFLESLASGCFPLGTYFGGMKASIDSIAGLFPPDIAAAMKLNPLDTVADIVKNVSTALRFGVRYKDVLGRTAQERYDWTSVGRLLLDELATLGDARGAATGTRG